MNNYKISASLFFLCILLSCDRYNLDRTNPLDTKSEYYHASIPELTTWEPTSITTTSVAIGGNVTSDGGAPVSDRGVCWSLSNNPTIASSPKTHNGTGASSFSGDIALLAANTVYHIRAYATNSAGTGYGNEITFKTAHSTLTDVDGNEYYAIEIGTQIWMRENLKVTKYRNGEVIISARAYLDVESNVVIYGRLYAWEAIKDSRKVAPVGWHVPADSEWTILTDYLGGESIAGDKLKEKGITHWQTTNDGGTNESGFLALPGGRFTGTGVGYYSMRNGGYWWSSTENGSDESWYRLINANTSNVYRSSDPKNNGLSIRCVKD